MAGLLAMGACGDDSDGGGAVADADRGASDEDVFAAGCAEAVARFAEAQASVAAATGSAVDGEKPDFGEVAAQIEALAEAAPAGISDDFRVYADQLIPFYRGMAELDLQPGEQVDEDQAARLAELGQRIDNEALETATGNIQTWFEEECDLD